MKRITENVEEMVVLTRRYVWVVKFNGVISSVYRMPKGSINPPIPSDPGTPRACAEARPLVAEVSRRENRVENWNPFYDMLWRWRFTNC